MAYFKFTKAILAGDPIDAYAEAQMSRDFTYIDDVREAILRLASQPAGVDLAFDVKRRDPAPAPWRIQHRQPYPGIALAFH